MTECNKCSNLLKDYLTGTLAQDDLQFLEKHVAACKECRESLTALREFSLRRQEATLHTPLPLKFDETLHMKLAQAKKNPEKTRFFSGFFTRATMGIAAASLIVLITLFLSRNNDDFIHDNRELVATSEAEYGKPLTIELTYEAAREIRDVELHITLGEAISFHSENPEISERKTLSWKGNLEKGKNTIPFTVAVTREGSWEIDTRADYEGFHHIQKVVLTVDREKVVIAYYKLPLKKIEHAS